MQVLEGLVVGTQISLRYTNYYNSVQRIMYIKSKLGNKAQLLIIKVNNIIKVKFSMLFV